MLTARRESVPFAFVADADRFRSNVEPPPKPRASRSQKAFRLLATLTVLAGLAGSVVVGSPALNAHGARAGQQRTTVAQQHH